MQNMTDYNITDMTVQEHCWQYLQYRNLIILHMSPLCLLITQDLLEIKFQHSSIVLRVPMDLSMCRIRFHRNILDHSRR